MGKCKFRISGKFGFTEDCLWVIQYSEMNTPGEKGPSITLVGDGKSLALMRGVHYFAADRRAMSNQIYYFIYYAQKENQA